MWGDVGRYGESTRLVDGRIEVVLLGRRLTPQPVARVEAMVGKVELVGAHGKAQHHPRHLPRRSGAQSVRMAQHAVACMRWHAARSEESFDKIRGWGWVRRLGLGP